MRLFGCLYSSIEIHVSAVSSPLHIYHTWYFFPKTYAVRAILMLFSFPLLSARQYVRISLGLFLLLVFLDGPGRASY